MLFPNFVISSLLRVRRDRGRDDLQPASGTLLHIGIIALGVPAKIPVTLLFFLRGRLNIHLRLLLDGCGR
jgi:hypothetical protein